MSCRNSVAKNEWQQLPYENLFDMFQSVVKKLPDGRCLGRRVGNNYQWDSFKVDVAAFSQECSALFLQASKMHDRLQAYRLALLQIFNALENGKPLLIEA